MDKKLLFVGGDLSGIQKFIYNISSKKAMVSLKGRSQFLSDYTKNVCDRILAIPGAKNAPDTECIYCSGGKFYIQLPNTEQIKKELDIIKNDVTKELWNQHNGQLSINISYVSFEYTNDKREKVILSTGESDNIGILWRKLTENFNSLKNQKFKNLLINDFDSFFEVTKVPESVHVCAITGIESGKCVKLEKDSDGDEIYVLPSVREQVSLGKKLRDIDKFKMLEEYAENSYLGILRMDVDGLGKVFIDGFKSMEDYKAFSKKLDYFFDSRIGNLANIVSSYKEYMNIVYAGGDDIFAVGRWDKVVEFAADVRSQFKNYVNKDGVSISGGVAIVGPKFPIAKAAELAGEAEYKAKSYEYKGRKKNAFCLFGEAFSWDDEYDYILRYKNQFIDLIQSSGLSRGILHKIMRYAEIIRKNKIIEEENKNGNQKQKPDMSFMWHTTYYLTRFMGKEKENKVVYDFCKELRDRQLIKIENFRLMSLAARWAELELRKIC